MEQKLYDDSHLLAGALQRMFKDVVRFDNSIPGLTARIDIEAKPAGDSSEHTKDEVFRIEFNPVGYLMVEDGVTRTKDINDNSNGTRQVFNIVTDSRGSDVDNQMSLLIGAIAQHMSVESEDIFQAMTWDLSFVADIADGKPVRRKI